MNVNATLLVQMLNFFIVYLMLRRLLFKPVVAIIQHEESQEKALHDIIDQQKKSLDIQEKERQRNWYVCQEYFANHQPSAFQKQQFFLDCPEDDAEIVNPLSAHAMTDSITDVRTALEEKIKHVH
jgi:hypothetical protein